DVLDILLERALLARCGGEARQRQQLFAALEIFPDAFLDHGAERTPDFGERLGLLLTDAFQLADRAAGHGFTALRELRIVLQHFAGNVQRQILAVDHATDEA